MTKFDILILFFNQVKIKKSLQIGNLEKNSAHKYMRLSYKYFYYFKKIIESFLLINYWPMSNLTDIIGGRDLFGGASYSFVSDKFCSPNSAIYFNQGFLFFYFFVNFCLKINKKIKE